MKKQYSKAMATLLGCCLFSPGVIIADDATTTTSVADVLSAVKSDVAIDRLPVDNVAYLDSSRNVRLKLDLMSAMPNSDSELNNALVTVVRPDGEASPFTPSADGTIVIDNVIPGPHAIIASSDRVHGAMMYYFDELPANVAKDKLDFDASGSSVKMTMLKIKQEELRSAIDRCRSVKARMNPFDGVGTMSKRFSYSVNLGDEGTLTGQLVPFTNSDGVLADTDVTIYFDGTAVGTTMTDANGRFQIAGLRPGVHGLVASGRAGYSAFAFDAFDKGDVAATTTSGQTLVASMAPATDVLPVVLIPPPMVPATVEAVETYYPGLQQPLETTDLGDSIVDAPLGDPIGPIGGAFGQAPISGGAFGGGGVSGGGIGGSGLGGLAGLAGIGAVIAATSDDDDNNAIAPAPPASPSMPSISAN